MTGFRLHSDWLGVFVQSVTRREQPWLPEGDFGSFVRSCAFYRAVVWFIKHHPGIEVPCPPSFVYLFYTPFEITTPYKMDLLTVMTISERFSCERSLVDHHLNLSLGKKYVPFLFGKQKIDQFAKLFPLPLRTEGCPATYEELSDMVTPAFEQMFSGLNPLASVTDDFSKVAGSVQKAADMISKTVTEVGSTANDLLLSAKASFMPIQKFAERFDAMIGGFSKTISLIWDVLIGYPELSLPTFGLLLVELLKSVLPKSYLPILRTGLIMALTAGLGFNLLSPITEFMEKATGTFSPEGIVQQSFGLADMLAPLASIYVMLGVSPENKGDFIRALKDLPHFAKGAQFFLDAFLTFAMKLSSFVTSRLGWSNDLASLFNEDYKRWIDCVNKVAADNKNNCIDTSMKGIMEVETIIEHGVLLQKELHSKSEHTLNALVLTQLKSLTTMVQEMKAQSQNGNDRPMPVSIVFRGAPGMGKSVAMTLLAEYIVREELQNSPSTLEEFEANPSSYIYVRSKDPYFDDFSLKKMAIVLDDFPTMLSTNQEDAAWPSLIDMLNTTRKPVPVANLEKKGSIYFNQVFTGITTNTSQIKEPLLISIDAVASRLNFVFTVTCDKYEGRSLREAKPEFFDPSIWKFTLNHIDGADFRETGYTCDFESVLAMVKHQISVNRHDFETRRTSSRDLYHEISRKANLSLIPKVYNSMKKSEGMAPEQVQYLRNAHDLETTLRSASNEEILALHKDGTIDDETKDQYLKPVHQMMRSVEVLDLKTSASVVIDKSPPITPGMACGVVLTHTTDDLGPERFVIRTLSQCGTSLPPFDIHEMRIKVRIEAGFFKQDISKLWLPIPYVASTMQGILRKGDKRMTYSVKFQPGATLGRIINFLLSCAHLVEDQKITMLALDYYNYTEVELIKMLLSYGFYENAIKEARKRVRTIVTACAIAPQENWLSILLSYKKMSSVAVTFFETEKNAFETAGTRLLAASKRFADFVGENYKIIIGALTCLAGFSALYAYAGKPIPDRLYATEQDSSTNNTLYLRKVVKEGRIKRAALSKTDAKPQDYVPNIVSIYPKILKSMFWIKTVEGKTLGSAVNIEAKLFMMPRHFFDKITDKVIIQRCRTDETYECEVDLEDFYDGGEPTDVAIVRLINKRLPSGADLTAHFTNKGDIFTMFYNASTEVFILAPDMSMIRRAYNDSTEPEPILTSRKHVQHNDSKDFITDTGVKTRVDLISYEEKTIGGSCGSLVFYDNKIVGMHTGGNGGRGFAAKVDRTMFHWYKNVEYKNETHEEIEMPELNFYGAVEQSLGYDISVHNGEVSAILEKPRSTYVVQDIVPYKGKTSFFVPTIAPVNITPRSFEDSRRKLVPVSGVINDSVMRHVAEQMALRDLKIPWDGLKVPYDLRTCLMGLPGTGFKPMPRDTSPGFPYSIQNKSRKDIFRVTEDGELRLGPLMPEVLNFMENFIQASLTGGSLEVVFLDNVKFEQRPLDKLDKARVVSSTPFYHFLLGRHLFGPFFRWMAETCDVTCYLTGFNPYEDWDLMERKFIEKDGLTRSCAGDYSQFDKNHRLEMIEYVWLYIELWFGKDGYFGSPQGKIWGTVRRSLLDSTIIGKHLYSCILEIQPQGMASGSATTTSTNCIIGALNLQYCYIMEGLKIPGATKHGLTDKFYQDVYFKVLGDDIRFSVSKRTDFFDNFAFRDQLAILGYKYGSADKNSELTAFMPSVEAGLLKRYPRYDVETKRWYGPIALEVITNMMCYHTKNRPETIKDRGNSAIRELAFHSQETWDFWFPKICDHIGPDFVPPGLFRHSVLEDMSTIMRGIYTQSFSDQFWRWAFFTNGMEYTKELAEVAFIPTKTVITTLEVLRTSDVPFLAFLGGFVDKTFDLLLRQLPDLWAPYIDDVGKSTGKFEKDFPFITGLFSPQLIDEREFAFIHSDSDFVPECTPIPEEAERSPCDEQHYLPTVNPIWVNKPRASMSLIDEGRRDRIESILSEVTPHSLRDILRLRQCDEALRVAVTKPCLN